MASLGEQLKNTRISSDKSLDEISRDTNISRHYLESLEEENYEIFPSPAYVKGFLGNYARYLGLDPDAVIQQYERRSAFNDLVESGAFQKTANRHRNRSVMRKRLIVLLLVVLIMAACLVLLILKRT